MSNEQYIKSLMKNRPAPKAGMVITEYKKNNEVYHDTKKLLRSYRVLQISIEKNLEMAKERFRDEYSEDVDTFLENLHICGMEFDEDDAGIRTLVDSIRYKRNRLMMINQALQAIKEAYEEGDGIYWTMYYTYMSPSKLKPKRMYEAISEKLGYRVSQSKYYEILNEGLELMHLLIWG